jgi:hypothetical protein
MPQPLPRVLSTGPRTILIGNANVRVTAYNPSLGALAMEAIISWSNVESFMLNTYLRLLGGPTDPAATGYLALEGQSAKTSMIKGIAQTHLADNHYKLLSAILAIAKTNEKSRNKLAHWTWGVCLQIPDGFLLVDPKDKIDGLNDETVYVYKEQDFKDIIEANDKLCGYGLSFSFIIGNHPANAGDALYNELCAEPAIRERLVVKI